MLGQALYGSICSLCCVHQLVFTCFPHWIPASFRWKRRTSIYICYMLRNASNNIKERESVSRGGSPLNHVRPNLRTLELCSCLSCPIRKQDNKEKIDLSILLQIDIHWYRYKCTECNCASVPGEGVREKEREMMLCVSKKRMPLFVHALLFHISEFLVYTYLYVQSTIYIYILSILPVNLSLSYICASGNWQDQSFIPESATYYKYEKNSDRAREFSPAIYNVALMPKSSICSFLPIGQRTGQVAMALARK